MNEELKKSRQDRKILIEKIHSLEELVEKEFKKLHEKSKNADDFRQSEYAREEHL